MCRRVVQPAGAAPDSDEKAIRTVPDLDAALKRHYPDLDGFLPGQREALEAVLQERDVVAVLPTGGGKTLVYQLATHLLGGVTVVATPLIALMQDQVRRLRADGDDQRVVALSGSLRGERRAAVLEQVASDEVDVVFSTPEQLSREDVRAALGRCGVALFVVDEAHCISEWGFDFRPAYRELSTAAALMGRPPVLAMTATAPEAVRRDVATELSLDDPVVVARGFDRPNLSFEVVRVTEAERRDRQLVKVLGEVQTPAVVYCTTRREAEETSRAVFELGATGRHGRQLTAGHYHGGMERGVREEVQNAFLDSTLDVLCATSAFGMGIDKPDIRAVIHRTMPDSLEAYWQEAGRAGRDGSPADCVLVYRQEDRAVHEHLHRRSRPSEATVAKMVHLFSQVTTPTEETAALSHIAATAEVARSGVVSLAEDLDRFGYVQREGTTLVWAGASGDPRRAPEHAMEELAAHHAAQVEVEQSRLDMVASYAESTSCRRRYLLNYLGDAYDAELCLRCDNCLRRAEGRGVEEWDVDSQRERVDAGRSGPFEVGSGVTHPEWGAGIVQRVEGDVLVVRFDAVGYRSMHAPTVVERGLLIPA